MNLLNSISQLFMDILEQFSGYYEYTVIFLPKLIIASIILGAWWIFSRKLKNALVRQLTSRSDDPLAVRFIGRLGMFLLMTAGILFFLKIIGMGGIATGILGTAGVSAFIIGFAFKDIGEHFLAGFVLAFNRPFRVGDLVELSGAKGKVIGLDIRNTHLKTFDGRDLYVPNGNIIKNTVVNYTIDGYIRHEFKLGLDYQADLKEAIALILKEMKDIPGILKDDKKPSVAISELGDSALQLMVYYWLNTFDTSINGVQLRIDVVDRVLNVLGEHEFYLPGQIIELKNYNNDNIRLYGEKSVV